VKLNGYSNVILSGSASVEKPKIKKEISSFTLFGPFNNKIRVSFDELNELENKKSFRDVFIVNKLENLIPNAKYEATISASFKVDDFNDKTVKVGLINYEPEMSYNTSTKNIISNISTNVKNEFNDFKIIEGLNKINTNVKFQANEVGEAWLVFDLQSANSVEFNFSVGQVKVSLKEIKNDN